MKYENEDKALEDEKEDEKKNNVGFEISKSNYPGKQTNRLLKTEKWKYMTDFIINENPKCLNFLVN